MMGLMIYNTSLADAFLKKHGVVNFKDLGEANGAYFVKMRDRCLLNLESSLKKQSFFIQVEGRLTFQELPELMQFIQNDPDGECRV